MRLSTIVGDCWTLTVLPATMTEVVVYDCGGNSKVAKGNVIKLAGEVEMILTNTEESRKELIVDSHLVDFQISYLRALHFTIWW